MYLRAKLSPLVKQYLNIICFFLVYTRHPQQSNNHIHHTRKVYLTNPKVHFTFDNLAYGLPTSCSPPVPSYLPTFHLTEPTHPLYPHLPTCLPMRANFFNNECLPMPTHFFTHAYPSHTNPLSTLRSLPSLNSARYLLLLPPHLG